MPQRRKEAKYIVEGREETPAMLLPLMGERKGRLWALILGKMPGRPQEALCLHLPLGEEMQQLNSSST